MTQPSDARRKHPAGLTMSAIVRFWLPLVASWLLMTAELPAVNALVARMSEAKLQLAAFGVAYSLALAVESPIISQLTAGNALAREEFATAGPDEDMNKGSPAFHLAPGIHDAFDGLVTLTDAP